jgi:sulfate adenylyltransferase
MPERNERDTAAGRPSWHPGRSGLELAELVVSGALARVPAGLELPAELVRDADGPARGVVLEDAEGTPVAILRSAERDATGAPAGGTPTVTALRPFTQGPVRPSRRTPAQIRSELAGLTRAAGLDPAAGVLGVPVTASLTSGQVEGAIAAAARAGRPLLWLAVFGADRKGDLPAAPLWRAVRALAAQTTADGVPAVAVPVAVPLLGPPDADAALLADVATGYGATEVLAPGGAATAAPDLAAPDLAVTDLAAPDLAALHPLFAQARAGSDRPPSRRGVTVFFTGLSGSGKSTVAKALADELEERSDRTVSLLDGDEVRRLLSAGLGFGRADRDLNIRRIGFVATEVCRHGGLAICAPIAPFEQTRAQVRAMVQEVGDFLLIHVATPLSECERRDRKGLYARARAGEIPEFTGISSPYEVPVNPDLRIDTSRMPVGEAVGQVWDLLAKRGYLG